LERNIADIGKNKKNMGNLPMSLKENKIAESENNGRENGEI